MEYFKNFFECDFCQSFNFNDLEEIIKELRDPKSKDYCAPIISDLAYIIEKRKYKEAQKVAAKYGSKIFDLNEMEKFIKFLHDRLSGIPTNVKSTDFIKTYDDHDELLNMELLLPTDPLTWFFRGYFNRIHPYEYLDESIQSFKYAENPKKSIELADELARIIESGNYNKLLKRLKKHSLKKIRLEKAKKLALFIYNRFKEIPTDVKPTDFKGKGGA